MTIGGPGGIGKTTVALATARGLMASYDHGVRLIDLADVGSCRVPHAFAAGVGLEPADEDSIPELVVALADKRMLLVVDNCEHVIEATAALTLAILNGAPEVRILATSREPLRAESEQVYRLAGLACPPETPDLKAKEALDYPAVQLFVERATATLSTFGLGDTEAPVVAQICRTLDGIPLAIEQAAARIDALGVRGLAAHLRDPLQLLTGGRRASPVRHRSLRATLDWSYDLLLEVERLALRRLTVFTDSFTLEEACAVAASPEITPAEVVEHVANLVTKSLVAVELNGSAPSYRLFGTTRAYTIEKLSESAEVERVAGCQPEAEQQHVLRARTEPSAQERVSIRGRRVASLAFAPIPPPVVSLPAFIGAPLQV